MSTHRKILKDFIELYELYPCLWQTKTKDYRNRQLRQAAYKVLTKKLRELEPEADKDAVVRKINNLRSCVRKEKKKYKKSLESGATAGSIYRPKLWYYDSMSFLDGQEEPRDSKSNMATREGTASEIDGDDFTAQQNSEEGNSFSASINSVNNSQNSTVPLPTAEYIQPIQEKTKSNYESLSNEVLMSAWDRIKRPTTEDRYDIIGKGFAVRLRELEKGQRIMAEKIINDVLFEAEMGNLTIAHLHNYSKI